MTQPLEYQNPKGSNPPGVSRWWLALGLTAAAALLLVTGLLYLVWVTDTAGHAEHNVAEGDRMIQALEVYRATHGTYPPTLQGLVPRFLRRIPRAERADWGYSATPEGSGFRLVFEGGPQDAAGSYYSDSRLWQVDTK